MTSLSERSLGLSGRVASNDRPRHLQEVALLLVDGTQVRGFLHRAPGTRTLDFLNHQAETFVAMTDAVLTQLGETSRASFLAVNKAHIIRVVEAGDGD
ncbi:MAG: hypothetical protein M3336_18505 [Chloroflexota bacterium]|nr:hypothetical protein [Chloroflexota bacterium]